MKKSVTLQSTKGQLQEVGLYVKPPVVNWREELQIKATKGMKQQLEFIARKSGMVLQYNRICTGGKIQDLPSDEIEDMSGVTWIKPTVEGLEVYNISGDMIRKYLTAQHVDKNTGVVSKYSVKIPDGDMPTPDTLIFT